MEGRIVSMCAQGYREKHENDSLLAISSRILRIQIFKGDFGMRNSED